jgi:hypothetical protein
MIPNFTFSSRDASRLDTATGYVDFLEAKRGAGVLLSLFGYNSGAAQFLQLFDVATGAPTLAITSGPDGGDAFFDAVGHGLLTGDKAIISGITGIADSRIWFLHRLSADRFTVHATLAEAISGTNAEEPDNQSDAGTLTHVPLHTALIGAGLNFSTVVPVTGLNFSRGLVAAVSTTGPLYTAGTKQLTMCGTLLA